MTLSRRAPLQWSSPLRSRSPLVSTSPLARASSLPRSPMVRRRPTRIPEEVRARALVAARSGGRCEGCGRAPATEWAHRVSRAQLGPWCPSNGLHLCSSGVGSWRPGGLGCHEWSGKAGNRIEAESVGWMLRRHQDPATTPALLHAVGLVLLGADGSMTPVERTAA